MLCMLSYDALLNRLNGKPDKKWAYVPPEEDPDEAPDEEPDVEEGELG